MLWRLDVRRRDAGYSGPRDNSHHFQPASQTSKGEVHKVYMYDSYERLWHWLQTAAIVILLFTGLVIHRPDLFGAFSFRNMVYVHNIIWMLLAINAALSLFYHLASGRIKQFIPRPYGFFDEAIIQAKYYIKGIFKHEPHPFEKTPEKKMNPLQQVTYFGILNVLLPSAGIDRDRHVGRSAMA